MLSRHEYGFETARCLGWQTEIPPALTTDEWMVLHVLRTALVLVGNCERWNGYVGNATFRRACSHDQSHANRRYRRESRTALNSSTASANRLFHA